MIPMDIAFPVGFGVVPVIRQSDFSAECARFAFDLFETKPAACVTCARLIDQVADAVRDADAFTRCLCTQSFMGIFFHCDGDFFHGVDRRIFCKQ